MFDWTFKIFSVMSDKQYNELKQEIQKMALNFDNLDAAVAKVQADVQNVLRVLTEGEAPAWSYRYEDGEIEIVMGRKRDYKRNGRVTIDDVKALLG